MTKGGMQIMMKNKFVLIRYVLMLWMLCGASYTQSIASAYDRTSPSASWGYQPLHGSDMSVNSSVYGGAIAGGTQISGTYSAASSRTNALTKPTYQFSSTSPYLDASNVGGTPILMSGGGMMRSGWGGDPNDDEDMPIGTTPVTPIGEPLVLLFFALAFLGVRYYRRRNA
jgi:hypothetical protein